MSNYDLVMAYTQEYATWLGGRGYPHPAVYDGNRLPRPAEILAVLGAIPGDELEVSDPYVLVSPAGSGPGGGCWLTLEAPPKDSWDDESWEAAGFFTVKADYEQELAVVIALAGTCGQLVIYPDTGAVPVIVDGTDDAAAVAGCWRLALS